MFTSRAEYRLLLREDNADLRLSETGHRVGLLAAERYEEFRAKREGLSSLISILETSRVPAGHPLARAVEEAGGAPVRPGTGYAELFGPWRKQEGRRSVPGLDTRSCCAAPR